MLLHVFIYFVGLVTCPFLAFQCCMVKSKRMNSWLFSFVVLILCLTGSLELNNASSYHFTSVCKWVSIWIYHIVGNFGEVFNLAICSEFCNNGQIKKLPNLHVYLWWIQIAKFKTCLYRLSPFVKFNARQSFPIHSRAFDVTSLWSVTGSSAFSMCEYTAIGRVWGKAGYRYVP